MRIPSSTMCRRSSFVTLCASQCRPEAQRIPTFVVTLCPSKCRLEAQSIPTILKFLNIYRENQFFKSKHSLNFWNRVENVKISEICFFFKFDHNILITKIEAFLNLRTIVHNMNCSEILNITWKHNHYLNFQRFLKKRTFKKMMNKHF